MKKIIYIAIITLISNLNIYSQSVTTNAATSITQTSATLSADGESLDSGKTYKVRFYYDTSSGVSGADPYISTATFTGGTSNTFSAVLSDLNINTQYYFLAVLYSVSGFGENYEAIGSELNFTTLSATVPTAVNGSVTNINTASADVSGDITDNGGATVIERGICYSTSANPTIANFKKTYTAGTGPYTVTLINLTAGTKYYYRAYAINSAGTAYASSDGTFTTFGTTEWIGGSSVSWENSANWSNGVPTSNISVIIPATTNDPEISSSAQCKDLLINAGGVLTIKNGWSLAVSGNYYMEASSSSPMAQLVIKGSATMSVSGTSQTELYVHSSSSSKWQLISIPIPSTAINLLSGYFVNSYDETTNSWENLNIGDVLTKGNGYSIKNSSGNSELVFTGPLNNGSQTISISSTNGNGWNLIGNPYPSTIDWAASSGWTRTGYDSTVYYYDYNNSRYASYNRINPELSTNGGTRYIPPMQGFWIHVSDDDTGHDLTMTNDVRVANQQAYWKKGETKASNGNTLKLFSDGNGYNDEIIVAFNPNATEDFDPAYDAYKLFSTNTDIPQIYTTILSINEPVAVNVIPNLTDNFSIPLGFYVGKSGTYTISAEGFDSFSDDAKFYLKDLELNIITDLEESDYEFTSGSAYTSARFLLQINTASVSIAEHLDNKYQIYSHGKAIYISSNGINKNSYAVVYNVLGEEMIKKNLDRVNLQKIENNFSAGTYLVKIHSNKRVLSKKVVIE